MKKIILIFLCCSMLVTTVSCNNSTKQQTQYDIETNTNNTSINNKTGEFSNLQFYNMRSSYDSFYINRNPAAKCAITDDSSFCVYIQEWNEYRIFPFSYDKTSDLVSCISICENIGILINETYGQTNDLDVLLFSKDNDEIIKANITLDKTTRLCLLYCDFFDTNNGYIFAFEETSNDSFSKGCVSLAFLFKTYDGGKTWTETKINNSPIVSRAETPCIAEFINGDIGIISCRYSASEDMCERTFFTYDGGKTWQTMSALPYDFKGKNGYDATEISDFSYADGEYLLNIKVRTAGGKEQYHLVFKSHDLNSWILIEQLNINRAADFLPP